jgi:hypothetical protein
VVPLFRPAVILLDAPIESPATMLDFMAEHFRNGTRIRIVPIAGDLSRRPIYDRESATEEALAAAISRVALSIESTRLPSRSMAQ